MTGHKLRGLLFTIYQTSDQFQSETDINWPFDSRLKTRGRTLNYPLAPKLGKKDWIFIFERKNVGKSEKKCSPLFLFIFVATKGHHHALNLLHFYAKSNNNERKGVHWKQWVSKNSKIWLSLNQLHKFKPCRLEFNCPIKPLPRPR